MKKVLHLLPNAHLDPVWLWDRFEGGSEAVRTCRSMVKLLKEYPEMRFNRGEAFVYDEVRKQDPETFEEIRALINAGRWEIVGGNWVQSDDNMPLTETMNRQFAVGQAYFERHFGRRAAVAWTPDSFGHSAGLPEILAFHGFRYVSFMRPFGKENEEDVFVWHGQGGAKLLACRLLCYTAEHDPSQRLDLLLQREGKRSRRNIAIGFGCGDHGGGTTRWQIEGALKWAERHPEVELRFSTFSELFADLEKEIQEGLPVAEHQGEVNYCLRGCYASLPGLKTLFRRTENAMFRAEQCCSAIGALLKRPADPVAEDWQRFLFNTFHDILPGSAIRRAVNQQKDQLAGAADRALEREFGALNALIGQINMPVPPAADRYHPEAVPMLLFNPLPRPWQGLVEIEESLDYRPIYKSEMTGPVHMEVRDAAGRRLPVQEMKVEHNAMFHCIWRMRGAVPVTIPAGGWQVVTFGLASDGQPTPADVAHPATGEKNAIGNEFWQIKAAVSRQHLQLRRADGLRFPLSLQLVRDKFGSWGGMAEEKESIHLHDKLETWRITQVKVLDAGPLRSRLFVTFSGSCSRADFIFSLDAGSPVITGTVRVYLNDRAARLMLALPQMAECCCDVPGGEAVRRTEGQFPAVRYLKLRDPKRGTLGFAANGAYGFDNEKGFFRYGLAKNTIFAADQVDGTSLHPEETMEQESPEITFLVSADGEKIASAAEEMMMPPAVAAGWPHEGKLPAEGTLFAVSPACVRLLDLQFLDGKAEFTLQNVSDVPVQAQISFLGKRLEILLPPWRIVSATLS